MTQRSRLALSSALVLCAALTFVGGCSRPKPDGMPKLVPCTVRVTQEEEPLAGATVELLGDENFKWTVSGTTDAQGNAKIHTHGDYPGAPEGSYKVAVSKQVVEQEEVDESQMSASYVPSGGTAYNCVDPQYGKADTTPLTIDVKGKTSAAFDVGAAIHEPVKPL